MAEHRTDALQVFGVMPEITKLYGDRYALTFRCNPSDNTEGWYYDNKDNLFASFDTLMDAGFGDSPTTPNPDSTWPDQRLVRHNLAYPQGMDTPVVVFEYETLTDAWVKEQEDTPIATQNGLRALQRIEVSRVTTSPPYDEDDVGVATITDSGKTLYLAGFEDQSQSDSQVQIGRFASRWAEAGTLQTATRNLSEGVVQVSTTFLAVEGATVGPIISRSTQDVSGLKTITVTTLQDSSGNPLNNGGENLVNSYDRHVGWTYPGVVGARSALVRSVVGTATVNVYYFQQSPVQCQIKAKVYVLFTDSQDIDTADYTYDGASGLWNPTQWAGGNHAGWSAGGSPIGDSPGFRGCRVVETEEFDGTTTGFDLAIASDGNGLLGRSLLAGSEYRMRVSGGPEKPDGNKYTLDIQVAPAFEDVDGNTVYKKTIVVATIPAQGSSTLT